MPKIRAKNDPSYEGRLLLAIDAVKSKKITKIREAARTFDVTLSTLQARLRGSIEHQQMGIKHQKLTPTEDAALLA
jgi:helix-turn-helix, Psq domain